MSCCMDNEIKSLIKVWSIAITSLIYCYFIPLNLPKGKLRFISLIPIIYILTVYPMSLTSAIAGGNTVFFLTWLCNFKLLLLSFGKGPLSSSDHNKPSLSSFISIACLPITIKQNPSKISKTQVKSQTFSVSYALKGLVFAVLCVLYPQKDQIHPKIMLILYCFYLYLGLELTLAMVAALAKSILGVELEPQFDDPYLSTSLQDFWGRRWNLMVSNILHSTVYDPVRFTAMRIVGTKWAPLLGVLASFMVSGLMHELAFYYHGRVTPTWEVTRFFALHGICLCLEIMVKKVVNNRWKLHPVVSVPLTIGFISVTAFWLFFPPIIRCETDVKASHEVAAFLEFIKSIAHELKTMFM